jgi:DNA-binding transcriptional ArsR family regulator
MTEPGAGRQTPDQGLVAAMGHSVRFRLLAALANVPAASAVELARKLDLPPRAVRHHLSQLHHAGLIEIAEERARRGVAERFYRRVVAPQIDDAEFQALTPLEQRRIDVQILKLSYADAAMALSAGTINSRPDNCVTCVHAQVDNQGWQELAEVHRRAYEEVERVKAESAERLGTGEEEPIPATSTLMWFELPKP